MAKVFITGSADGLGQMAAKALVEQGHEVVLHTRNELRGKEALKNIPGAKTVLTGDLSNLEETKELASKVNALGTFDAIIHNAGAYRLSNEIIFTVNTLSTYILTCLVHKPKRIVYMSSGMHLQGDCSLLNLTGENSRKHNYPGYSDTKLHDLMLSLAVARKWKNIYSNAVNPGWVPTKMGGQSAPDSLEKGYQTQVWLAVSEDATAKVSGHYFHHQKPTHYLPAANEIYLQDKLLSLCEQITGVAFPVEE